MNAGFQAGAPAGDHRTKDLIATVSSIANSLMGEVSKVIIGKNENLRRVTVGILSNGNMLLEDFPGLAKTLLANTFAQALGCKFKRVQFTPDLLPSDIMGTYMYDQKSGEFKLRAGPLFANILLADEINRAPPKTQAALLEAMEEKQVTIEGITHKLPAPFVVIATQNPIEQEGTYPLPEAQMDRFLLKITLTYPEREDERTILRNQLRSNMEALNSVVSSEQILKARTAIDSIYMDEKIESYILDIVFATRFPEKFGISSLANKISFGASPRGSIALAKAAKCHAFLRHRGFVIPEDVRAVAPSVLRHRIGLTYEAEAEEITQDDIVTEVLNTLMVP